jgi:BirA family transcriptional regulator, biotin operon repressor / biotin---[acetyl-CoA-carboxylase] ligase
MNEPPRFEHLARIDSTSTELMRRPFGGAPGPVTILLADVQDVGRGRNGRRWLSDASRSLAVSVVLERRVDGASLLGLPLAVGVAIAGVLAAEGVRLRLKWPNDLFVDAAGGIAKAGGILVEARQSGSIQRIVVGVGLNLQPSPAIEEGDTGQPVGALFAPGAAPDRVALARTLGEAIAAAVGRFPVYGLGDCLPAWRALDALAGQPVELIDAHGARRLGLARGIDDDGALRVERADGSVERIVAGEVSVRRREPAPVRATTARSDRSPAAD